MVEGQGCFFMFTFQTLFLSGKSLMTYCGIIVLLLLSSSWVSATHFLKVLSNDISIEPLQQWFCFQETYQNSSNANSAAINQRFSILYANRFMALELFSSVLPKFELQQYIDGEGDIYIYWINICLTLTRQSCLTACLKRIFLLRKHKNSPPRSSPAGSAWSGPSCSSLSTPSPPSSIHV